MESDTRGRCVHCWRFLTVRSEADSGDGGGRELEVRSVAAFHVLPPAAARIASGRVRRADLARAALAGSARGILRLPSRFDGERMPSTAAAAWRRRVTGSAAASAAAAVCDSRVLRRGRGRRSGTPPKTAGGRRASPTAQTRPDARRTRVCACEEPCVRRVSAVLSRAVARHGSSSTPPRLEAANCVDSSSGLRASLGIPEAGRSAGRAAAPCASANSVAGAPLRAIGRGH